MVQIAQLVKDKKGKRGIVAFGFLVPNQNCLAPVFFEGIGYCYIPSEDLEAVGQVEIAVSLEKCGNCDHLVKNDGVTSCAKYTTNFVVSLAALRGQTRVPSQIYPLCQLSLTT